MYLPDSTGVYFLHQVEKSITPNDNTPIIMLTGNHNKAIVKKSIASGASGYIIKPLSQASLSKLFNKYHIPLQQKVKS